MKFTRILQDSNLDEKQSELRLHQGSQNECFKKTKHAKFSEKQTFLTS